MQINKEKEQSISNFIENLMEEKSPSYKELNNDVDLLSMADIALFLKKGDEAPDNNFRNNLEETLLSQLKRDKLVNNELRKLKKTRFTRFAIGFASVLLVIASFTGLKTPKQIINPVVIKNNDIVKVEGKKINKQSIEILQNKENYATLYWSLNQMMFR
ncbi:MAG: hypothetical protein DRI33_00660 [Caldiserica bacterium]|nr:MAG: hypothetical protein DRI33_00660 [Caldisericota bacterium]